MSSTTTNSKPERPPNSPRASTLDQIDQDVGVCDDYAAEHTRKGTVHAGMRTGVGASSVTTPNSASAISPRGFSSTVAKSSSSFARLIAFSSMGLKCQTEEPMPESVALSGVIGLRQIEHLFNPAPLARLLLFQEPLHRYCPDPPAISPLARRESTSRGSR